MKCTRLEDWYERNGDDPAANGWQDVLTHARGCPDCAFAMEGRARLLETLRELPEPVPPADLSARISQYLDLEAGESDDPDAAANLLDDLLGRWLRPLQVVLSAACVLTLLHIVRPGISSEPAAIRPDRMPVTLRAEAPAPVPAVPDGGRLRLPETRGQALARLDDEEIAAFLRRLDAYRHTHPEIDAPRSAFPSGMLAVDR
ncbi:MAG TPA: hypothetical protein PLP29_01160 [Candidatus Ozemobacteraceae bacterium]|nr:hypothetical protein [Candidatus Ozemobacteraceae bacterium]